MASRDPRDRSRDARPRDDRGRQGDRSSSGSQGSHSQKSYRAQLDRLFSSGKIGELVADAEKARKFVSDSNAPSTMPPEVRVTNGKVTKQVGGGTAADERERESRAGLGQELARAIARAESGEVAAAAGELPREFPQGSLAPAPRRASAPVMAKPEGTGEDAETRLKLVAKLRGAEGRDAITRATEALAARFTIPDDFELLTKVLEHRADERVKFALERLEAKLKKEQPRRGRTLAAQLRFLEETHADAEVQASARTIRALVK